MRPSLMSGISRRRGEPRRALVEVEGILSTVSRGATGQPRRGMHAGDRFERCEIHYEAVGSGFPVVFSHELASDMRAWEPQVRHFARSYRFIPYNNRGYPPSGVPADRNSYSHDARIEELRNVLRDAGAEQAHVVGLATGGNVALNFAIAYPEMTRSIVVAGILEVRPGELVDLLEPPRQAEPGAVFQAAARRLVRFLPAEGAAERDPRRCRPLRQGLRLHVRTALYSPRSSTERAIQPSVSNASAPCRMLSKLRWPKVPFRANTPQ